MSVKLIQKSLFKSTQTFEIIDDAIDIRIKSPLKEERLTVMLAVLNPEPVITQSRLEFTSRVNNEALVSFYLGKPNAGEFTTFINTLKEKIQAEFHDFAGLKAVMPSGMEHNVFEEPEEFDSSASSPGNKVRKPIRLDEISSSIQMLSEYIGDEELNPLISALKSIESDPENLDHLMILFREFEALGPRQGAVLTYAPYIGVLMSDAAYRS